VTENDRRDKLSNANHSDSANQAQHMQVAKKYVLDDFQGVSRHRHNKVSLADSGRNAAIQEYAEQAFLQQLPGVTTSAERLS
jgi:hypothetical protein